MYVTQRGTETETIPYAQLDQAKRREILEYYVAHGRQPARRKYNLSNQTIGHLIFHHKELIEQIEDENFRRAGL